MKGGGDTITKLDDICQVERIGIMTEMTVASTRIMLNIAVVFHRCNQMITSDDPSKYLMLYHWRNTASHHSIVKQYLKTLYNKLIDLSSGDELYKETVELANCDEVLTL